MNISSRRGFAKARTPICSNNDDIKVLAKLKAEDVSATTTRFVHKQTQGVQMRKAGT